MFRGKNFARVVIGYGLTCFKDLNMKTSLLLLIAFVSLTAFAQKSDELKIRGLLAAQTEAWNRGDAEGFMQGYWKSDSLMFIGKSGVKWGVAGNTGQLYKELSGYHCHGQAVV